MKKIDESGVFWLRGFDTDQLPGRLQFDPVSGNITLSLLGIFRDDRDQSGATKRILGTSGTELVTLDDCFSLRSSPRSPGIDESQWRVNRIFLGYHANERDHTFDTARVTFSNLAEWVETSGISENASPDTATGPIFQFEYTPPAEETARFSQGRVALCFSWTRDLGTAPNSISFNEQPGFRLEYDTAQPFDIVKKDIGRIQSLLTLCTDSSVMADRITLSRQDIHATSIAGNDLGVPRAIEFIAPQLLYVAPEERKQHNRYQMLLTYPKLGGIQQVARWIELSQKFQRALDSFVSIRYVKQIYAENRFMNVTFAAEAFHRDIFGGHQMDYEFYEKLLQDLLDVTPADHQEWLRDRLEYANTPTLAKRLRELITLAAPASGSIIGNRKMRQKWINVISMTRNQLAHLGDRSHFPGEDLVILTESVYAVVRICMLRELGTSADLLAEKAASLAWYRDRLANSIERLWQQFKES